MHRHSRQTSVLVLLLTCSMLCLGAGWFGMAQGQANAPANSTTSAQTNASERRLAKIHANIVEQYPAVTHIQSGSLPAKNPGTVYFDVREPDEFAVSHLEGALQVDPEISADEFYARFGEQIANRQLVFYCSVGRRASRLIQRLHPQLAQSGVVSADNLQGGIFTWHNEGRVLYQAATTTDKIHPFSWFMSRLLVRRKLAVYRP